MASWDDLWKRNQGLPAHEAYSLFSQPAPGSGGVSSNRVSDESEDREGRQGPNPTKTYEALQGTPDRKDSVAVKGAESKSTNATRQSITKSASDRPEDEMLNQAANVPFPGLNKTKRPHSPLKESLDTKLEDTATIHRSQDRPSAPAPTSAPAHLLGTRLWPIVIPSSDEKAPKAESSASGGAGKLSSQARKATDADTTPSASAPIEQRPPPPWVQDQTIATAWLRNGSSRIPAAVQPPGEVVPSRFERIK